MPDRVGTDGVLPFARFFETRLAANFVEKVSPVARETLFNENCVEKLSPVARESRISFYRAVGRNGVFMVVARFSGGGLRMCERCRNWNTDPLD